MTRMGRPLGMFTLLCALWGIAGCAQTRGTYVCRPEVRTLETPLCEARLRLLRDETGGFVRMELQVLNKSEVPLHIDWNRTQYVLNGKAEGVMVFKGIDPERIRSGTVPDDVIPGRGTFTRTVAPFRMLARPPMNLSSHTEDEIMPGILPPGENGLDLVLTQEGRERVGPVALRITVTEVPAP